MKRDEFFFFFFCKGKKIKLGKKNFLFSITVCQPLSISLFVGVCSRDADPGGRRVCFRRSRGRAVRYCGDGERRRKSDSASGRRRRRRRRRRGKKHDDGRWFSRR